MCESGGHFYCWKCRTEVEVNAKDSVYGLNCNECYEFWKEKLRLEWMQARENKLNGCQVCLNAYRLGKKSEIHKCPMFGNYQCGLCAYQMDSSKYLSLHFKVVHGWKKSYLRTHSEHRPFECKICKRWFASSGSLKVHLRSHTGEKPYACRICKKTFKQISCLTVHLRTHTGERPFSCQLCQKAFAKSGNLKMHLRIHTKEKPYNCKICNKAFAWLGALQVHLRSHTGERPFACQFCKKAYAQSSQRNMHLKTHTREKPFESQI